MCTAQVESHIFSKTWIFHKKKNNSFEKFVLTSFDRATPSERQKFTFGSFNFWLWKWISQKVSFTFKNDKLALHFDRLQQNLVPILFPITIFIITIMLNLDERMCVKGGKMRVRSVRIFQTWCWNNFELLRKNLARRLELFQGHLLSLWICNLTASTSKAATIKVKRLFYFWEYHQVSMFIMHIVCNAVNDLI